MKHILITESIKGLAKQYKTELDGEHSNGIDEEPVRKLKELKETLITTDSNYRDYIDEVIACYKKYNLVELFPSQYNNFHINHFSIFDANGAKYINLSERLSKKIKTQKGIAKEMVKQPFYMHIVNALCYKRVQSEIFPKYLLKLGIRSCVYCNAAYAVSSMKGKNDNNVTYTLDHYKPKRLYPYLAVSFYNLYPCCSTCNSTKSINEPIWNLYIENQDEEKNPFEFKLKESSLIKYSLMWDPNKLNIEFTDKVNGVNQAEDYVKYFHIKSLYNCFKPEVEELLWKQRIYNETMIEQMSKLLPKRIGVENVNRFILGNYDNSEDILKRPLAKLMQDIGRQIHLI